MFWLSAPCSKQCLEGLLTVDLAFVYLSYEISLHVLLPIEETAHTVKFQICTIGGAHVIFQTFVSSIYFIFKCRHPVQFEEDEKRTIPCSASFFIAWQLVFMTQLELTRDRFFVHRVASATVCRFTLAL